MAHLHDVAEHAISGDAAIVRAFTSDRSPAATLISGWITQPFISSVRPTMLPSVNSVVVPPAGDAYAQVAHADPSLAGQAP